MNKQSLPLSPSPQYFEYLLREGIAKIVFIGTSGCGKSEVSKKFSSFNGSFRLPSNNDFSTRFDVLSVDLAIAKTLVPRIKKDLKDWFSSSMQQMQSSALKTFFEASEIKMDNAQELDLVTSWMGNVLYSRKWYKYSSFWYTRTEEEETLSFRNVLNKGLNGVIDTTGSVFVLDNASRNTLCENSLIIYINSLDRAEELGNRIITDSKPISLSSLRNFQCFLESVASNNSHEIYSFAEQYGVDRAKIKKLSENGDLETLIRTENDQQIPNFGILDEYKQVYDSVISLILGYYYANHEMCLRHDLYKRMRPHLEISSNDLYGMSIPDLFDWTFANLEENWKHVDDCKSRVPKKLPKPPKRYL